MSVNALLSTIILVTFIVTVVLAIGSYVAYKMRERRRPEPTRSVTDEPIFFERFFPGDATRGASAAQTAPDAGTR